MRRLILLAFLSVLGLLATTTPASAITDGRLDGDGHPYVGLMVAQDADGNPMWRCSGTLVSPTLYLTAGHCTDGAVHVEIWFDAGTVGQRPAGYPTDGEVGGTPYTHPDYVDATFWLADLGVVVLDEPVAMDEYGQLPELGALDGLKPSKRTTFTSVGYGLQRAFPDAASWKDQRELVRMVANPHLIQIGKGYVGDWAITLSNNADTGGTCFGDSGGPNFLGDSNVIAGVTSYAKNSTCGGQGGVYRVDQADDLSWLQGEFADHL
jgi:hypothetical protein